MNISYVANEQILEVEGDIHVNMNYGTLKVYDKRYSLLRAKINLIYASEEGSLNTALANNTINIHGV